MQSTASALPARNRASGASGTGRLTLGNHDLGGPEHPVLVEEAQLDHLDDRVGRLARGGLLGDGLAKVGVERLAQGIDRRDAVAPEQVQELVLDHRHPLHQRSLFVGLTGGRRGTLQVVQNRQQIQCQPARGESPLLSLVALVFFGAWRFSKIEI